MKLHALPTQRDRQAMDAAHGMRALLDADIDESAKAGKIQQMNSTLDQDLLLACWRYLNSDERRAWKLYCKG